MAEPSRALAYLDCVNPTTEAALRSYIQDRRKTIDQPCTYRTLLRPPLDHLFGDNVADTSRAEVIKTAHEQYGYKLAEIARHLAIHPTTVSRIYCSTRRN